MQKVFVRERVQDIGLCYQELAALHADLQVTRPSAMPSISIALAFILTPLPRTAPLLLILLLPLLLLFSRSVSLIASPVALIICIWGMTSSRVRVAMAAHVIDEITLT